jgi:hypothetical protein
LHLPFRQHQPSPRHPRARSLRIRTAEEERPRVGREARDKVARGVRDKGAHAATGRAGEVEVMGRAGAVEVTGRAGAVEVTGRDGVAEARVHLRAEASRHLPSPSHDNRPRRATHTSGSHGDFLD